VTAPRPLSDWVASVPWGPGPVELPRVLVPNDGDERRDARDLARFASDLWRRTAVQVRSPHGEVATALGLEAEQGHQRVIELDDFGRPLLLVSAESVGSISALEQAWPQGPFPEWVAENLGGESAHLRWTLVARLAGETPTPSAKLFWLLPWGLVDELAIAVATAAAGGPLATTQPLRHYFAVTGSRFSAALEHLQVGLRRGDPAVVAEAAVAFCQRLVEVPAERIPSRTRQLLAEVSDALARRDLSLNGLATAAQRHLRGEERQPDGLGPRTQARAASVVGPGPRLPTTAEEPVRASMDDATGELAFAGLPPGPAGTVELVAVPGALLAFDAADGHLSQLVLSPPTPGEPLQLRPEARLILTRLFGEETARRSDDPKARRAPFGAKAERGFSRQLFRLALLGTSRHLDPFSSSSPLWDAEAAWLASQTGLTTTARAKAEAATPGLVRALNINPELLTASVPERLFLVLREVAELAGETRPEPAAALDDLLDKVVTAAADRLLEAAREPALAPPFRGLLAGQLDLGPFPVGRFLDLAVLAVGLFLPAEEPPSDIALANEGDALTVRARLVGGASREEVRNCWARLVGPAHDNVLAEAPLVVSGNDAMARLPIVGPPGQEPGRWVEIVPRRDWPVRDSRWRTVQRAWRWGHSALRAERMGQDERVGPRWARCAADWEAVPDPERAFLAGRRAHARDGSRPGPASPGTAWADLVAQLAHRPEKPFLAEAFKW
jgi:hypothetical protein